MFAFQLFFADGNISRRVNFDGNANTNRDASATQND
jgi:hypothetical protein